MGRGAKGLYVGPRYYNSFVLIFHLPLCFNTFCFLQILIFAMYDFSFPIQLYSSFFRIPSSISFYFASVSCLFLLSFFIFYCLLFSSPFNFFLIILPQLFFEFVGFFVSLLLPLLFPLPFPLSFAFSFPSISPQSIILRNYLVLFPFFSRKIVSYVIFSEITSFHKFATLIRTFYFGK